MSRRIAPAERDAPAPPAATHVTRAAMRGVLAAALVALPLVAWLARASGLPRLGSALSVAAIVLIVAGLARALRPAAGLLIVVAMLALGAGAARLGLPAVYLPPVAINLAVALVFAASLMHEPLVVRFARLEGAVLTPDVLRYCRRLTLVWAIWLAVLSVAGVGIALSGDERLGAWWAGALDYVLVGALFVGEFVYRGRRAGAHVVAPGGLLARLRGVRAAWRAPRA